MRIPPYTFPFSLLLHFFLWYKDLKTHHCWKLRTYIDVSDLIQPTLQMNWPCQDMPARSKTQERKMGNCNRFSRLVVSQLQKRQKCMAMGSWVQKLLWNLQWSRWVSKVACCTVSYLGIWSQRFETHAAKENGTTMLRLIQYYVIYNFDITLCPTYIVVKPAVR